MPRKPTSNAILDFFKRKAQEREEAGVMPIRFLLPKGLPPGSYDVTVDAAHAGLRAETGKPEVVFVIGGLVPTPRPAGAPPPKMRAMKQRGRK